MKKEERNQKLMALLLSLSIAGGMYGAARIHDNNVSKKSELKFENGISVIEVEANKSQFIDYNDNKYYVISNIHNEILSVGKVASYIQASVKTTKNGPKVYYVPEGYILVGNLGIKLEGITEEEKNEIIDYLNGNIVSLTK